MGCASLISSLNDLAMKGYLLQPTAPWHPLSRPVALPFLVLILLFTAASVLHANEAGVNDFLLSMAGHGTPHVIAPDLLK